MQSSQRTVPVAILQRALNLLRRLTSSPAILLITDKRVGVFIIGRFE